MKIVKDKDGTWENYGSYKLLVKPSPAFEERRRLQAIESAKAQVERDKVQAERDRCIAYLKKQKDLIKVDLTKTGLLVKPFTELKLEMSFEDIIESVRVNREAALREVSHVT